MEILRKTESSEGEGEREREREREREQKRIVHIITPLERIRT